MTAIAMAKANHAPVSGHRNHRAPKELYDRTYHPRRAKAAEANTKMPSSSMPAPGANIVSMQASKTPEVTAVSTSVIVSISPVDSFRAVTSTVSPRRAGSGRAPDASAPTIR